MKAMTICLAIWATWLIPATGLMAVDEEVTVEQLARELTSKLAVQDDGKHLPGVALAEGVSQITGTAISPLLGVASVGAWKWFNAEPELRAALPWFAQPEVWGTGFAILALCFLKDAFGTAAPPLLKKPLDWAELFEDKASALVAAGAFVPLIVASMSEGAAGDGGTSMLALPKSGMAAMPLLAWLDALLSHWWVVLPFALVMFGAVWLCSHAVNVLIAFSPLGIIDAILKLAKLGMLGLVTVGAMISPWLGLIICLPIVIVCLFLSGWAFRWMMFGSIFGWDVLLRRKVDKTELDAAIHGFMASKVDGVPARTFGRVLPTGSPDQLRFDYRPWMVLPKRSVTLENKSRAVSRGVINPSIIQSATAGATGRTLVVLPPRYRGREEIIAGVVGAGEVTDGSLIRGFKAAKQWLAEVVNSGRPSISESRAA